MACSLPTPKEISLTAVASSGEVFANCSAPKLIANLKDLVVAVWTKDCALGEALTTAIPISLAAARVWEETPVVVDSIR